MIDRIPRYPGRVRLTPVSGQTNVYDMVREDEPVQEGTPLNKATLLSDATASALGLSDATVDEALGKLKTLVDAGAKIAAGSYTGTDKSGSSNPNRLTFSFVPKLVIVAATSGRFAIMVNGSTMAASTDVSAPTNSSSLNYLHITVSWSGNSVSWYNNHSIFSIAAQLNSSGLTYNYIAIG